MVGKLPSFILPIANLAEPATAITSTACLLTSAINTGLSLTMQIDEATSTRLARQSDIPTAMSLSGSDLTGT